MLSSDRVKTHPQLVQIMGALLGGVSLQEVASRFGLEPAAVEAYAVEAGLGREPDPEPQPRQPEGDVPPTQLSDAIRQLGIAAEAVDRPAVHERQLLEEASRRRGDPESRRPEPAAHPYQDESRAALREILGRVETERRAYESQPMPHLTLCSDPDFHIGFQPESRLRALITREQMDKAEWIRQWHEEDLFRWRQPPPDDL